MKKRILISSVLTIVLCFSLIVGSTFALFTSEVEYNIAVTSGKVELTANASLAGVYSAKVDPNGNLVDPDWGNFSHELQTDAAGNPVNTFANGGNAVYDEVTGTLTITNITPGDKVELNVGANNASNVAIKYRYTVKVTNNPASDEGAYLTNALVVSLGGVALSWDVNGQYTSPSWTLVEANGTIGDAVLSIELPVSAGNEYQDIADVQFVVIVEAIQANGVN